MGPDGLNAFVLRAEVILEEEVDVAVSTCLRVSYTLQSTWLALCVI